MTPDIFEDLCLRALAGRDPAARAEVEALIIKEPALVPAWQEMQAAWAETGTVAADAAAIKNTEPVPIPAERLAHLMKPARAAEQARRSRARRVRWLGGLGLASAVCVIALVLVKGPSPSRLTLDLTRLPARAQQNFFSPALARLSTDTRLITWRSVAAPIVRSPRVATGWTQPVFIWESAPGAACDVTLRETGGAALFTLKAAHSPFALGNARPAIRLSPDKNYELLITPVGGSPENTAKVRFTTAAVLATIPIGQTPQMNLDALLAAMQSDPARLGDALALWEKIPRSWRASEAGVRTGFWLAQEAQLPGLLAEVQADAEKLIKK